MLGCNGSGWSPGHGRALGLPGVNCGIMVVEVWGYWEGVGGKPSRSKGLAAMRVPWGSPSAACGRGK